MIDLLTQKRPEVVALCRKHAVSRLDVFGSAAVGAVDTECRDLDFIVEFEHGLAPCDYADSYFALLLDLQLLFGRSVDLLTRASINHNPYFKRSVEASEQPLYAA